MTLSGKVEGNEWAVTVETSAAKDGGYCCRIHVRHTSPEGLFERDFAHDCTFVTEREALLEGLRKGMTWIELKVSQSIGV